MLHCHTHCPRSPTIQWLKDILASKEEERAGSEAARPPAPTGPPPPPPGPPPAPIGPENGPVDGSEAVAPMGGVGSSAGPGKGAVADGAPRVYPPVPPFEASVVVSLSDFWNVV